MDEKNQAEHSNAINHYALSYFRKKEEEESKYICLQLINKYIFIWNKKKFFNIMILYFIFSPTYADILRRNFYYYFSFSVIKLQNKQQQQIES